MRNNDEMETVEKEKASRFVHLFLNMLLRGFDEMEMQKRLELIDTIGFMFEFGFEKVYGRMIDFDRRLQALEKTYKKK